MKETILQHAKVLWEFSRLNQTSTKSEVMIVLGNDDPRTAEHAADLFLQGFAPFVLISGKEGTGTRGKLPPNTTEAEVFYDIMKSKGVPKDRMYLEKEATNTGENIQFSQRFLQQMGIQPTSVLVVTKSLVERRVALTFQKQWLRSESVNLCVASPPLTLLEYPSPHVGTLEEVVDYLLGVYEKFTHYAELGHQAPVDIPTHVQKAYSMLAAQR